MPGPTLIRAPPPDPNKSEIENVLELTPLTSIGPFTRTSSLTPGNRKPEKKLQPLCQRPDQNRELWHPPGARGVYGGAVIAQCLSAAQQTIPPPSPSNDHAVFLIHSMHCYFVLAGDSAIPILYHVERVRDGKSFVTRTVQARQKGRCIFTTTSSFVKEGSAGERTINHAGDMPADAVAQLNEALGEQKSNDDADAEAAGVQGSGPFVTKRLGIENDTSPEICSKKTRQWVKARGRISSSAGPAPHLSALAYMSDSYFIGTVALMHNLRRSSSSPQTRKPRPRPFPTPQPPNTTNPKLKHELADIKDEENSNTDAQNPRPSIGIMVSLDHTIYFHRPREIRADEWLLSENESPWSGDGRGLVLQRIWNRKGVLVASCVQEGLVRLAQEESGKPKL
ncbi:MAG: hypothetical protein Q9181_004765 [Wetmoreana brouardii]